MSMKKMNLLKLGLVATIAGSFGTASAETINGTATANVLTPLTLRETTALAYGDVYGGSTAGTVVVSSAGVISATGGAGFKGGAHTAATFDITGEVSTAITVTLAPGSAALDDGTAGGGGAPMALTAFTTTVLPTVTTAGGLATFGVGATLGVGINQTAGAYSTTTGDGVPYTVTVNYN
ncbi:MAG: DUF4402 domain-containing protein [Pseudomonadota bacterium]